MATTKTIAKSLPKKYPKSFYDEPDPEDRVLQFPPLYRVISILFEMYKDSPDVFATGGGFILYDETNGNRRVAPDFLIAFDVDAVYIRDSEMPNYLVWEIGKVPDFVMEVASESTAANDLGHKRELYERLGVQEYWRFDHHRDGKYYGQPLTGERLVDGVYQPYEIEADDDGSLRGYSELLNMVFYWDGQEFDALDPETGLTLHKITVAEMAREAADERAEADRQARIEAEARAEESEGRERELLEEIARLRQQQG